MIEANAETINKASTEQLSAIRNACALIAPNWPLDRFIAVNALWESRHHPIELVSARYAAVAGVKTTLSAAELLASLDKGTITESSLIAAAQAYKVTTDIEA
ncbi:MAG: putative inorganic carbon transporter subunit DabA, partial [Pseudomonadota bacterium]|nr:putative inorganic carbon transporter subunit DabA [Pseudomonadota bacterium]